LSAGTISLGVKADASGFGSSLSSAVKSHVAGIGGELGNGLMGALKTFAGPLAALAAGLSIKHIVDESTEAFENMAGSVNGMRRIMGGTVEQVSGMRGAMQLAGVNADATTAAFTRFSKNLMSAQGDVKKTADLSALLGTNIDDAHGKLKPMSELLPAVADKFKEMPNGIEKTALAVQLFGRSGTQMIPFLNKGSEGITELTAEAQKMGITLTGDNINAFAESRKATREWNATIQGLQVQIGAGLLPIIEGFQNALRDTLIPLIEKVTAWVKLHQKDLENLGQSIKATLLPILSGFAEAIKNVVTWVIKNKETVMILLGVIGLIVAAIVVYRTSMVAVKLAQEAWSTVMGIWKVATVAATAVQWLFNAAMDANPITLVIIAVVALIAAIIWIATQTTWFQDIWKAAMAGIQIAFKAVGDFISGVFNWIGQNWPTLLAILTGPIGLAVAWIITHWTQVTDFFKTFVGVLGQIFGNIGNFIGGVFKGAMNFVIDGLNTFLGFVNTFIDGIDVALDGIKTISGGAINLHVNHLAKLPHLAEGGIVMPTPGGRPIIAGDGKEPEAVIPLSKLNSVGHGGPTVNYYAAPNTSIDSEQSLFDAMRRSRLLAGW
jgi:phage-related protein